MYEGRGTLESVENAGFLAAGMMTQQDLIGPID